jgi:hypothetical protein
MHKGKNISWKGCWWGVFIDHMKVSMEFDLSIQDNKENVDTIKLATAFCDMEKGWQTRAVRLS